MSCKTNTAEGDVLSSIDPEKLKYRMACSFLDGKALAEKSGLTKQTIYHALHEQGMPRPETLHAICVALGCKPEDLLKEA